MFLISELGYFKLTVIPSMFFIMLALGQMEKKELLPSYMDLITLRWHFPAHVGFA